MDAWERAYEAGALAGVDLRVLVGGEQADRLVRVMVETWGVASISRDAVVALIASGNVPVGAWIDDQLAGFVLGWIGMDEATTFHMHSHMLAVTADRRKTGIGYALKLAQRAQSLEMGLSVVRWTFDPLLAANAYFNIAKLGAVADRFESDFYGEMDDALNKDERTDRLIVRWDLGQLVPTAPIAPRSGGHLVLDRLGDESLPSPGDVLPPESAPALIRIPPKYRELRQRSPEHANMWRARTGDAFRVCLRAGLIVTGFTRDGTYVLS